MAVSTAIPPPLHGGVHERGPTPSSRTEFFGTPDRPPVLPSWPCRFDPGHPLQASLALQGWDPLRHNAFRRNRQREKSRQRLRFSPSLKAGHANFEGGRVPSARDSQCAGPDVRTGDSPCRTSSITHARLRREPRLPSATSSRAAGPVLEQRPLSGQGCEHGPRPKRVPGVPVVSLRTKKGRLAPPGARISTGRQGRAAPAATATRPNMASSTSRRSHSGQRGEAGGPATGAHGVVSVVVPPDSAFATHLHQPLFKPVVAILSLRCIAGRRSSALATRSPS